jgi:hypothetical protein
MQKHKSFTKPWRKRLAERLSVALCLTVRTQDDARREIAAVSKGIAADVFMEARRGMDVACSAA